MIKMDFQGQATHQRRLPNLSLDVKKHGSNLLDDLLNSQANQAVCAPTEATDWVAGCSFYQLCILLQLL